MEGESGRVRVGLEAEWVRKNTALAKSVPQKSLKAALCSPTPGADFLKWGMHSLCPQGFPQHGLFICMAPFPVPADSVPTLRLQEPEGPLSCL